jgi:hypothetical protein
MLVKKASERSSPIVVFHLYQMSRLDKAIETGHKVVVSCLGLRVGGVGGRQGVTTKGW